MKFFGKNNDLRTEDGKITPAGYLTAFVCTVFGLWVFLAGRKLYGQVIREKHNGTT